MTIIRVVGRTVRHLARMIVRLILASALRGKTAIPVTKTSRKGPVTKTSRKGVELAFFSVRGFVVRVSKDGDFTTEYMRLRQSFSEFVPSAEILALSDDRNAILEEFIIGDTLAAFDRDSSAYREALTAVTSGHLLLVQALSVEADSYSLASIPSVDSTIAPFREHQARVLAYLGEGPLVPSHGDLHSGNLLVRAGGVKTIDFGSLAMRPAWFDAVRLVQFELCRVEASPTVTSLVEQYCLDVLSVSVGWNEPPADWRRLVSLAYIAWRAVENPRKVKKDWADLQPWAQ